MAVCEVFCWGFVDIRFENALISIVEDSIWLQLMYSLTTTAFWFVKYIFQIHGDTLNELPQSVNEKFYSV